MKIAVSSTSTLVTMNQSKKEKELLNPQPFPTRLFTMLEESQRRGFDDVISWQPGGESFRVYKADRFASEIAADFFALRKYKSFLRQLNIYG
jgi:heat shock transcription factor, other eukaryote